MLLLAILVGCAGSRHVPYTLIDATPQPLQAPAGYFWNVAWLPNDLLAFVQTDSLTAESVNSNLIVYDVVTGIVQNVPLRLPQECITKRYGRISVLPDGRLGYILDCVPSKGNARDTRLYAWDTESNSNSQIYAYPAPFWATLFSMAPSMTEWLQEQQGDGLNNKLYMVANGGELSRLFEGSLARAGWPTWRANGQILFAGTPQLPESGVNIFSGLPALTSQLNTAWTIYTADRNIMISGNITATQIILGDIVGLRGLRVSPVGNRVAFLGEYDGYNGLWIYDLDTKELARLWNGFGPFDWSPDGSKLVVLENDPASESFDGPLGILEVPKVLHEKHSGG